MGADAPPTAGLDAVVVGSGPNGLAAAIALARAGRSVLVLEARDEPGGGCRSAELTLPGFVHDVCSAVHPLAVASPFFRELGLDRYGLKMIHPDVPLAHPLGGDRAAVLERSLDATVDGLGPDGPRYRRLIGPFVRRTDALLREIQGPLRPPRAPITLASFGMRALWPASALARVTMRGEAGRALFAGMAAHAMQPLGNPLTAAVGIVMAALGHAYGWPVARDGSGRIVDALVGSLRDAGGRVECGRPVRSMADLPPARAVLFDITPRQILGIAGDELPSGYRRRLEGYRYGPGIFKLDLALSGPIPWTAEVCRRAGTVHVGGTLDEISAAEAEVGAGRVPERPFVLAAQQSVVDPGRAPSGKHTAWLYCHVPSGSTVDMTDAIESQVERFAPGFRDLIIGRRTMAPAQMEAYNANYVGGDINGGIQDWRQLYTRPVARVNPYTTPNPRLFICSSATPPGGGVHGMCGYHAASAALRRALR